MPQKNPTEAVILGTLMSGPKHGYDMLQILGSALEPTWRISTSQLYLLLKRMEKNGGVRSSVENQPSRPPKRVFRLTPAGREAFLAWLRAPVPHVRDFRMEFLGKLFFYDRLCLPGAGRLVRSQVRVLEGLCRDARRRLKAEEDRFKRLEYGFRVRMMENLLSWLRREALAFAEENADETQN